MMTIEVLGYNWSDAPLYVGGDQNWAVLEISNSGLVPQVIFYHNCHEKNEMFEGASSPFISRENKTWFMVSPFLKRSFIKGHHFYALAHNYANGVCSEEQLICEFEKNVHRHVDFTVPYGKEYGVISNIPIAQLLFYHKNYSDFRKYVENSWKAIPININMAMLKDRIDSWLRDHFDNYVRDGNHDDYLIMKSRYAGRRLYDIVIGQPIGKYETRFVSGFVQHICNRNPNVAKYFEMNGFSIKAV